MRTTWRGGAFRTIFTNSEGYTVRRVRDENAGYTRCWAVRAPDWSYLCDTSHRITLHRTAGLAMLAAERHAERSIDTSDIPEAGEDWWKTAALKKPLDAD